MMAVDRPDLNKKKRKLISRGNSCYTDLWRRDFVPQSEVPQRQN